MGTLLLAAILALHVFFARGLLYLAGEKRWSIAFAFSFASLIATSALIGRYTSDLVIAASWSGVIAGAGVALIWRRGPRAPPEPRPSARVDGWAIAIAALGLVLVVWTALHGCFWDESNSHFGLVLSVARGVIPAEHPLFPGEPFRYHYGFDVLAGLVRAFVGLGAEGSIDAAAIACYLLLLALGANVGAELGGRRGASLALVLAPLGSGLLQVFLFRDFGAMELSWSALPSSWADSTPPPVISNFFQHPQGLGMPLSLAVLLLWSAPHRRSKRTIGAVLLGLLSLAQIVFFSVLGLALGVSVLARAVRERNIRSAAIDLVSLLGSLAIAVSLGGFFAPGARSEQLLQFKGYFNEPILTVVLHHVVLFGLPILALPIAALRLKEEPRDLRLLLLVASFVGFFVPNTINYEWSWDIVKFFGVGAFFANLLLADAMARFWRPKLALPLIAIATGTAWFWLARVSFLDGKMGITALHFPPPAPIAVAVGERLDRMIGPRDRVLSTNMDLSMGAGLLTPGFDWRALGASFIMDRARVDRLRMHLDRARRDLSPEDLAALETKIVVLGPGDIASLSDVGRKALQDNLRFEHLFDVSEGYERRSVYRVVDPDP
jgi:hypothetical protein